MINPKIYCKIFEIFYFKHGFFFIKSFLDKAKLRKFIHNTKCYQISIILGLTLFEQIKVIHALKILTSIAAGLNIRLWFSKPDNRAKRFFFQPFNECTGKGGYRYGPELRGGRTFVPTKIS